MREEAEAGSLQGGADLRWALPWSVHVCVHVHGHRGRDPACLQVTAVSKHQETKATFPEDSGLTCMPISKPVPILT